MLVRALGRQLHLRHLAGLAGAAARSTFRWIIPRSSRPLPGSKRRSKRSEPGERRAGATTSPALKGTGEPTPSQTAWATLGLIAAGTARSRAVRTRDRVLDRDPACRRIVGRELRSRAPGFPACSTSDIITTECTFPMMAIARYQQRAGAAPAWSVVGATARPTGPASFAGSLGCTRLLVAGPGRSGRFP